MKNIFVLVTILGHLPVILSAKRKGSDNMKQILIVEDDNLLNKTLTYNLELDGYTITSVLNARTAAESLKTNIFDLVLLDINLPDGNGYGKLIPFEKDAVHTLSYDEKPGIQAIATTGEDHPPIPNTDKSNGYQRDYEYVRLGTLSLLAAIDLLSGEAIPLVSETHKSSDFVTFLKKLDEKYPKGDMIRIILDNHSAHTSKETQEYLNTVSGRFEFVFTPKHGSWLNMIEGFFSKMTKQMLGGIRVESKKELEDRIYRYFDEINKEPVPYKWTYKMDTIDLSQEDIDSIVYEVVNAKAASAENKNKKAPKTISRKRKSIQN